MTIYKKVDCLNDYVAVLNVTMDTGEIELTTEGKKQFPNEGVVVGIGPAAANKGLELGDMVMLSNKRYININPQDGGYKDKTILLPRMVDVLIRKDPGNWYKVE